MKRVRDGEEAKEDDENMMAQKETGILKDQRSQMVGGAGNRIGAEILKTRKEKARDEARKQAERQEKRGKNKGGAGARE